jgi:hypothetical protein
MERKRASICSSSSKRYGKSEHSNIYILFLYLKYRLKTSQEAKNMSEQKPKRTFVEVEDADFFKFENIGDSIEGKLIDKGHSEQFKFGLYTVITDEGDSIRFHGSSHLDSKLKAIPEGTYIVVKFLDVEKRPKGDMKLFSVHAEA